MPVIIRQNGFQIVMYFNDHEPVHVHLKKAGSEIKVNALTLELMQVKGDISNRDIRKALEIVAEHQLLINQKWGELRGKN
jgi:hypothetical protein